jgi:hypothetical protein
VFDHVKTEGATKEGPEFASLRAGFPISAGFQSQAHRTQRLRPSFDLYELNRLNDLNHSFFLEQPRG